MRFAPQNIIAATIAGFAAFTTLGVGLALLLAWDTLGLDSRIALAALVAVDWVFGALSVRIARRAAKDCVSEIMTGDPARDMPQSRHQRIYLNRTEQRRCFHTEPLLMQTYMRDTGEMIFADTCLFKVEPTT